MSDMHRSQSEPDDDEIDQRLDELAAAQVLGERIPESLLPLLERVKGDGWLRARLSARRQMHELVQRWARTEAVRLGLVVLMIRASQRSRAAWAFEVDQARTANAALRNQSELGRRRGEANSATTVLTFDRFSLELTPRPESGRMLVAIKSKQLPVDGVTIKVLDARGHLLQNVITDSAGFVAVDFQASVDECGFELCWPKSGSKG